MITKDMPMTDVVSKFPEVIPVLVQYGLGCVGCQAARFESLGQGAEVHGIEVEQFVADLNAAVETNK